MKKYTKQFDIKDVELTDDGFTVKPKSYLQLFYEERMWEDGMPTFDELTTEQRQSFEDMFAFTTWKVSRATQQVADAIGLTFEQAMNAFNLNKGVKK